MWRKAFVSSVIIIASAFVLAVPAWAARFDLVPASDQILANCEETFQVFADVTGESSNTADLIIFYNPAQVQVAQVTPGDAYQTYVANQIDNGIGRIRMTALSVGDNLTSRKLFATVRYTASNAATNVQFTVQFNGAGATTDSNIADSTTSLDLLAGVTNANFLVVPGSCVPDTVAPNVQFIAPTAGQTNFPEGSPLQVRVTDNLSGVNLNSLQFTINGQTYTRNSPEVEFSGTATNYLFTLNIPGLVPEQYTLVISGSDNAGNNFSRQNTFTVVATTSSTSSTASSGSTSSSSSSGSTFTSTSSTSSTTSQPGCECAEPGDEIHVQDIVEGTIFDNTVIDTILTDLDNNVGAASSASIVTGAAVLLSLIPYFSLLSTPGLILNVLNILLGQRRARSWGVIIDASTRAPVVFATCRVYLYGAKTFVDQTVTDTAGRYGFALAPGKYRLEVLHDKYVKHISEIVVKEGKSTPVQDILIYPLSLLHGRRQEAFGMVKQVAAAAGNLWRQIYPTVFVLGFVLAILGFVSLPTVINAVILILYVLISMISMFSKQVVLQSQSSVVDAQSNLRVPGAVIKIYNPKTWEVVDTQTTNVNGMFDYWGDPGEYALLVAARGYSFPSKMMPPTNIIQRGKLNLPIVRLKTGGNAVVVYVDPLESNDLVSYNDQKPINLANPFD